MKETNVILYVQKKIDNLIEKNNFFQLVKNVNNLLNTSNNIINLDFDFNLNNLVKEIIWTFEITIDNFVITVAKDISLTSNFLHKATHDDLSNFKTSEYDFILGTKFYLDGLRRDGIKLLEFLN